MFHPHVDSLFGFSRMSCVLAKSRRRQTNFSLLLCPHHTRVNAIDSTINLNLNLNLKKKKKFNKTCWTPLLAFIYLSLEIQ